MFDLKSTSTASRERLARSEEKLDRAEALLTNMARYSDHKPLPPTEWAMACAQELFPAFARTAGSRDEPMVAVEQAMAALAHRARIIEWHAKQQFSKP